MPVYALLPQWCVQVSRLRLESGNIDKLTVTARGINISSNSLDLNNIIENSKRIRIFAFLSVARVAKW